MSVLPTTFEFSADLLPPPKKKEYPKEQDERMTPGNKRPLQQNRSSLGAPTSLYQHAMMVIQKLYSLPDFEFYLFPQGLETMIEHAKQLGQPPISNPTDVLWNCFRLGAPLCHLFNQLRPKTQLTIPDVSGMESYTNVCKKCIFHFLVACKEERIVPEEEYFTITDLYKDDINGLVKVMKVVSALLERIELRGLMPPEKELPFSTGISQEKPTDNFSRVLFEILETEKTYLKSLVELDEYREDLSQSNSLTNDTVFEIFGNMSDLLDFQRRFIVALEGTMSLGTHEQRVGMVFITNEAGFTVYEPMCANYSAAINTALQYQEQLDRAQVRVKSKTNSNIDPGKGLQNLLIQPVQRITRYPLLLKELIKFSEAENYQYLDELNGALEVIKRVTDRVNEYQRVADNAKAKKDLFDRMEDWKDFNPNALNTLILKDKFPMQVNDVEREYHIYLFDRVLLCCKEMPSLRRKNELVFAVKGNIFMTSIQEIRDVSRPEEGYFELKVYWRDSGELETFTLRCRNQEQLRLWKDRFDMIYASVKANGRPVSTLDTRQRTGDDQDRYQRSKSVNMAQIAEMSQMRKSSVMRPQEAPSRSSSMSQGPLSPSPFGRNQSPFSNGYISTRRQSQTKETDYVASMRSLEVTEQPRQRSNSSNVIVAPPLSSMKRDRTTSGPSATGPPTMALPPTPLERRPPTPSERRPPNMALPQAPRVPPAGPPPSVPLPAPPPSKPLPRGPPSIPLPGAPSGPPSMPLPSTPSGPPSIPLPAPPSNSSTPLTAPPSAPLPTPPVASPPRSTPPVIPLPQSPEVTRRSTGTRSATSQLLKLKTHYGQDIFILAVPSKDCKFEDVLEKIERKIRICGSQLPEGRRLKLKYKDEDGDFIIVNTDEDLELAFEAVRAAGDRGAVNIYAE
ncbi:hypothetical protein EDD86DRAFT_199148 [Gorgonomyces haynaldii]|nr:hypothetical protein EDD86DRAFT_199148 [Gorgonomyces haynaldii]